MQIRHRSAYYDAFFTEALLGFVETGLASPDQAAASRRAIADMVDVLPGHQPRGGAGAGRRHRQRHHRAGAAAASAVFDGSSPISSRISASASMCRTATPPPARSRRRPRPAPPIRSSSSRCSTSMPATRSRGGANEPQVTVPLNDNIDYEGGVVTWIDNLAGERPFGNDLDPTLNLDILEVSFRNLGTLEDHRDTAAARHRAPHHRLSEAAGAERARSPSRGRTSIICRSCIAPISAAATPRSSRCRRRRNGRSTPTARST